jgi:enoyl-CoA hydratase/carnithine racemase
LSWFGLFVWCACLLVIRCSHRQVRVVLFWAEGKMFTAGLDLAEFAKISGSARLLESVLVLSFDALSVFI